MLDEADKAPLEVVAVLKSLLADGYMRLSDGRRVLSPALAAAERSAAVTEEGGGRRLASDVLTIHPDFTVLALANRPGFPFLGNDFFRECGTVFATHVVANPDEVSQMQLMRAEAPSVATHVLRRLVNAFDELRALVRQGMLSYPYSIREQVIRAHLSHAKHDEALRESDLSPRGCCAGKYCAPFACLPTRPALNGAEQRTRL